MAIPRKLTQNFVETEIDDEVLLVDLDGGELLSLSGTARAIWRAIDGVREETAIVARIGDAYAPQTGMAREIADFLSELRAARLID